MSFNSLDDLRRACTDLAKGDDTAAANVDARQSQLTKPPGSLGRLEQMVGWLARWQGTATPALNNVDVLVFAGNHGVVERGVSAFPAAVTHQMVLNFENGGAAINQLSNIAGASLRVFPISLEKPTADFTVEPAMTETDFLATLNIGFEAVDKDADLVCLGEMGIGNTTAAAALAAALFGGNVDQWVGRGTGVDDEGLARKQAAIESGLELHGAEAIDAIDIARRLGGRELAAILGATLAARQLQVPVLLDGFVSTAAAAPLHAMNSRALDHAEIAHVSAEAGHKRLAISLDKEPLLDLGMRLGEASGAALAVLIYRAALACHDGMATFDQAKVDNRD